MPMVRWTTRMAFALALGVPFLSGCVWKNVRDQPTIPTTKLVTAKPEVPALVNYLNLNARRVQSVRATVDIDCNAEGKAVGLSGMMACQKPRDFRLTGKGLGKPAVPVGSHNDEDSARLGHAPPPNAHQYPLRHLPAGKVQVPLLMQPDKVVVTLGLVQFAHEAQDEFNDSRGSLCLGSLYDSAASVYLV